MIKTCPSSFSTLGLSSSSKGYLTNSEKIFSF
jgi:hypothetical protein